MTMKSAADLPPDCKAVQACATAGAGAAAQCPALLVAAPGSGQGKTTTVAALARLHARQGRRVQVFKCGPDFIDPGWHQLASGRPVYNLDLWMCGEQDVRLRLHRAAQTADLILIEGVMGLFDGQPSAADLALLLDVPVMAVIDASKMAETFGAVAHGLQHWRAGLRWAGVLANRVGSERHAHILAQAVPEKFLGAVQRNSSLGVAERHLGLIAAQEVDDALRKLDAAADALALTPLGQMDAAALQQWNTVFADAPVAPTAPVAPLLAGQTIAVARDAAFQFIYAANIDTLEQLGARIRYFSPLADAALPACDAVWLPGGYPELHAATLAGNKGMAASIRAHVQAGKPVWAEGGGMLPLLDALHERDGVVYPMWGIWPGQARMQPRLAGLGLQQLALPGGGAEPLRGHAFHFSVCDTDVAVAARTSRPGQAVRADAGEALYAQGSVSASYFHPWFASSPAAAARLFGA